MKKRCLLLCLMTVLLCLFAGSAMAAQSGYYYYEDHGDGTCTILDYAGSSLGPVFPETLDSLTVTGIGEYVFRLASNSLASMGIKSVTLPDTVTTIAANAFEGCGNMTQITFGSGVQTIGKDAFSDCSSLEAVYVPSLESWLGISFANSYSKPHGFELYVDGVLAENVVIPSDVTDINAYAFEYCYSLTSVTIPGSVKTIHSCAFGECRYLQSVTISEGVESIDASAFYQCDGLYRVAIPSSVTYLSSSAFSYCDNIFLIDYTAHTHAPGAGGDSVSWTRWDGSTSLTLASGDNYVALACDVYVPSGITVSKGQHLHLCLDGSDLAANGSSCSATITVNEGGTLSLCDCSAQSDWGRVTSMISSCRGVSLNKATMYMYSGKVADILYTSDGAGVSVYNGSAFTMYDGEISGNNDNGRNFIHGAGVLVDYSSTFTMHGGKISGNSGERGAGVRVSGSSSMYMHGGEISGNAAVSGGAIYTPGNNVTIEITGGTITGNTAEGCAAIFNNASPESSASIRILGGSITGNQATSGYGGINGPVTLGGSAVITGNTSAGKASNLASGGSLITLRDGFTGTVGVTPTIPSSGSYTPFLKRVSGAVTADDLSHFQADNSDYALYVDENGQGVLGQKTYTLTLVNAQTADGKTTASVAPGAEVTISAVVPEGKTLARWENASGEKLDIAGDTFTLTMPIGDVTLNAVVLAGYTITEAGEGVVDVTLNKEITSALYTQLLAEVGENTIGTLTISESGVLNCPGVTIAAARVDNYGQLLGGNLKNAVLHNWGTVDGECDLYDLVNYEGATISGDTEREDGETYYLTYLYGEIENYGTISSVGYSGATVKLNEGTLGVRVRYNSGWDWDDGWGWDSTTATFNYGDRVGDVLGEGFYRTDGTYAIDDTLGLFTQLYHHWTRQESGSIYVKAAGSSSPVRITADMAGDATSIYVAMGQLITDELDLPVVLSNIECEDGTHYYTSGISGGVYNGTITVNEPGYMSNCTINGTLTLNSGTSIAQSVTLGRNGKVMVNSLNEITNIWGPSISSYDLPMTVAEGGSIAVSRNFYGDIINYGVISKGTYYGTVTNYDTLAGGTFNGKVLDYSAHEHAPGAGGDSVSWTRWDGSGSLNLTSGDNYIALACDVSTSYGITVNNGQHLHLCLAGSDLIRTRDGTVITVNEGGALSLCDCSAQSKWGRVTADSENVVGVYLNGAEMNLYSGKISGNIGRGDGAGVGVYYQSTLTMYGGEISGNATATTGSYYGGGVNCNIESTFIMYGGKISGNSADRGAGVRVANGSAMYMHGGEISSNTAAEYGGGIYSPSNTVTIEITGGTITGNTATNGGGAIFNAAYPLTNTQITITGGSITGNTAGESAGGINGPVTLGGSAVITGNTSAGKASNLASGSSLITLEGEFTGTVGVTPTLPASGSFTPFLTRTNGAVTAEDLSHFQADNSDYALYVDENGQGVLGQKTYTLTLENAETEDDQTTVSVAPGTEVTVYPVVPEGQVFVQWENGAGEVLSTENSALTFVMPLGDDTVRAVTVDEFVITDGALTAYNGEDRELVVLPDSVTAIGETAFASCPSLKTVILSGAASDGFVDTLPGIDKFFVTNGSLIQYLGDQTDVVLPECVVKIENNAGQFPAGVQSVTGPAVTYAVFGEYEGIQRVSLPVMTDVISGAFTNLTNLAEAELPAAQNIDSFAFEGLESLTALSLPMVQTIGDCAFMECSSLASVFLPKVQTIGHFAFSGCGSLTQAEFPNLTLLGEESFGYCQALESFSAPMLRDIPHSAFWDCSSLTAFEHDVSTAWTVGEVAFCGAGLKEIDLTNATSIGVRAFENTNLASVIVPDSVTAIGDEAFDADTLLRSSVTAYARTWAQENGYQWEHDVHNETVLPAQELTCTTDGKTEGLWCPECEAILVEQIVTKAPGHTTVTDEAVEPTCTSTGLTEGSHCETCGEVFVEQEVLEALGHTEATIPGFEPTCTEPGVKDYIFCETCGEEFQTADEIPALGHTDEISKEAIAPTCTEEGSTEEHACAVCGEVLVPAQTLAPQGHSEYESVGAVEPDCVHAGHTAEIICGVCGVVLTPSEEIPALGHTEEVLEAVAPTCTETGLTEGSRCTICGETIIAQEVVDALGHTTVTDAAVAPTDRETGLTEGSHCGVCGEVLTAQQVIPANFNWDGDVITGYNRENPVVVIPADAVGLSDTAFKNNTFITSVTMGDNILSLGTQTFMGCTGLTDVYLPDHLNNIGAQTFYGVNARVHCSAESATAVALSYRGVPFTTEDGWTLRYRVTSLTGTPSATWIVKYAGGETALVIPDAFNAAPVTQILTDAFAENKALTSVTIPETVTLISDRAFENCTVLATANFPGALKTLGAYAFHNTALTAAALPSGLTVAGEGAFAGCTALTSATLPEGLTAIADHLFDGCARLSGVKLPEGIASIGEYAFRGCVRQTSMAVPEGVTTIGKGAFYGCTRLTSVTLPGGLAEIADELFAYCTTLKGVALPASVTAIGENAFFMCEALAAITLPEGVTEIGSFAFKGCTALAEIVLPDSLTTVGDGVFAYCSGLGQLVLPDEVTAVGADLLANSSATLYCDANTTTAQTLADAGYGYSPLLTFRTEEKADGTVDVILTGCVDFLKEVVVPEGVTKIADYAFQNHSMLEKVTLPSTLKNIGVEAFAYCYGLKAIDIPDSVYSIGERAFYACRVAETLKLPTDLPILEDSVFANCWALEEVVIPETVESIGNGAFYYCKALQSINIPESVTSIGRDAFNGCAELASLSLHGHIEAIGASAFDSGIVVYLPSLKGTTAASFAAAGSSKTYRITGDDTLEYTASLDENGELRVAVRTASDSVTEAVIPEGVDSIADSAFSIGDALTSVIIPDSVTSIGQYAFSYCNGLTSLELHDHIQFLGEGALGSVDVILPSITCPTAQVIAQSDPNRFWYLSGDENLCYRMIIDENGEMEIEVKAASESITEAVIPEAVTRIVESGFAGCTQLKSIEIPDSVTAIEAFAFDSCNVLETVKLSSQLTAIEDYTFRYCYALTNLEIPQGVESIGSYAFQGCQALGSLTLPSSVTTLGEQVFLSSLLEKLYLPDNMTSMYGSSINTVRGVYVSSFDCATAKLIAEVWSGRNIRLNGQDTLHYGVSCAEDGTMSIQAAAVSTDITEAVIAEGATAIAESGFANCTRLSSVIIPETVTTIENGAFSGCTALTSVTLPDSMTSIGEYAFSGCSMLETVRLSAGLTALPGYLFRECTALTDIDVPQGVVSIGTEAFFGCTSLTTANLPTSLQSIGIRAFSGCTRLDNVTIPESVTSIGAAAFAECTSLTTLRLPANVTSIGGTLVDTGIYPILPQADCPTVRAFIDNDTDAHYFVVEGHEQICLHAGKDEEGTAFIEVDRVDYTLAEAVIPEGVTAIGWDSFMDHPSLTSVVMPDSVTRMEYSTFARCPVLEKIKLSANLTVIPSYAFEDCVALKHIEIPEGVEVISSYVFDGCTNLEWMTIPDSVAGIHDNAFANCPSCLIISSHEAYARTWAEGKGMAWQHDAPIPAFRVLPATRESDGMTKHEYCSGCGEMITAGTVIDHSRVLFLPAAIREIADEAFVGNKAVQITLPEGAQSIGSRAFADCDNLLLVVIPSTVSSIADDALAGCEGVTLVISADNAYALAWAEAHGADVFVP